MDNLNLKLTVHVSDGDIDDIMVGALEGGISYWCNKVTVVGDYLGEYASSQIARGGSLMLHDTEQEEDYELTKEKLLKGIELFFSVPENLCMLKGNTNLDLSLDTLDADDCDSIVQYALFGEICYS